MTEAEFLMVQRYNHDKDNTRQSEMNRLIELEEYNLFSILKPTLSKDYKGFNINESDEDWYEEMVLIPIVKEVRNVNPKIIEVANTEIIIELIPTHTHN